MGRSVLDYHIRLWTALALAGMSLGGIAISQLAMAKPEEPLQTVRQRVDLERYMGRWYEIAAIPVSAERNCIANATAEYALGLDSLVRVYHSCQTDQGRRIGIAGRAKVEDPETNAKLKVTFLNVLGWRFSMGKDYWITTLAPDYSYTIIGDPNRKYGWVLSRDPLLPRKTLAHLIQQLTLQGYDSCQFMTMPQLGGIRAKQPLCDVAPEAGASSKYRNSKRMAWPGE